jgi:hypothetical protein
MASSEDLSFGSAGDGEVSSEPSQDGGDAGESSAEEESSDASDSESSQPSSLASNPDSSSASDASDGLASSATENSDTDNSSSEMDDDDAEDEGGDGDPSTSIESEESSESSSSSSDEELEDEDSSDDPDWVPVNPQAARRNPLRLARAIGAAAGAPAAQAAAAAEAARLAAELLYHQEQNKRLRSERNLARTECMAMKHALTVEKARADGAENALAFERSERDANNQDAREALETLEGKPADMHKLIHKPAIYDGDNSRTHIVDWLASMMGWLLALKVPVMMWVLTASSYLQGEAARFWQKRAAASYTAGTWQEFREALLARFDSENTPVSARIQLDKLQQGRMTMAKFVQKFDFITSYITDIGDADLIHRFLEAVRPELKPMLQNDPSRGVRWTEYDKLRRYALNMFPDHPAATLPAAQQSLPTGTDAKQHKSGFNTDKRGRRGARVRFASPAATGFLDQATSFAKSALKKRKTEEATYEFRNSVGGSIKRPKADFHAIRNRGLCGWCLEKGHRADTCTRERSRVGPVTSKAN